MSGRIIKPGDPKFTPDTLPAFEPKSFKITKIEPRIGTVLLYGKINGQETCRTLMPRDCVLRAQALSEMRDRLRFPDERARIQSIIDELVEACRVCREKEGKAYISSRVSFSGAMYRQRKQDSVCS